MTVSCCVFLYGCNALSSVATCCQEAQRRKLMRTILFLPYVSSSLSTVYSSPSAASACICAIVLGGKVTGGSGLVGAAGNGCTAGATVGRAGFEVAVGRAGFGDAGGVDG